MFLPVSLDEAAALGWDALDVILVTGDSYIDSPFIGVAVIGKTLLKAGYRVGVIAQPSVETAADITRLGEPRLFWGVSGGCIDSMVANYTATGRRRRTDDYTPGGLNTRRPDRAVIVYSNLIRQHCKGGAPIVLGGLEASLRRVAHYDFWSNRIRRSILFDAKANYLIYGMGERSTVELADCLRDGRDPRAVRGLCHIAAEPAPECLALPDYETCAADKAAFTEMFHLFYRNNDPVSARPLAQRQDTRYLIQNAPAIDLTGRELDAARAIEYEREQHPFHAAQGEVKALETIRFSISTHDGCYGECNFCAIQVHQGRRVRWRSEASILEEARAIVAHPRFKGTLHDVGGPTANMYGIECGVKARHGACAEKRCLAPSVCRALKLDHSPQIKMLNALRRVPGVRRVIVASGIRYDMILEDQAHGEEYLRQLTRHHISGQMKIAPEHVSPAVLEKMGKPGAPALLRFREMFERAQRQEKEPRFLTYYFIAAHPGCTEAHMESLKRFATHELRLTPEQVQVFTPTPSTYSALMYWTGRDPWSGEPCFVEKSVAGKTRQKAILTEPAPNPGMGARGGKMPGGEKRTPRGAEKNRFGGRRKKEAAAGRGGKKTFAAAPDKKRSAAGAKPPRGARPAPKARRK